MKPTRSITPWLFLAPALLVFGFAVLVPMVATFGYSFTEWNGFGPMTFVGLDNYLKVATDPLFRDSFIHVCIYIAATLVLEVAVGLGLAGIISARAGGLWFRVAIFTPVMLPMVVVAILWSFVYNPDFGLVNATLAAVGLEELQRIWLGDTSTALLAVSVVSGWVYAGFYMMIFHAAFRQIPAEAVEAGRLDGAGEWDLFRRVKVPMIRNAVWVGVLLCVTGGFQGFDLFFVLTNGGPYGATEIPTTLLVKTVFRNGEVGYGSAMAVVLTAIVLAVGVAYARLQRRGDRPAVQVTDEDLTPDGAR
jgi:raffinose/stachyose/melibiose transport system permease protein